MKICHSFYYTLTNLDYVLSKTHKGPFVTKVVSVPLFIPVLIVQVQCRHIRSSPPRLEFRVWRHVYPFNVSPVTRCRPTGTGQRVQVLLSQHGQRRVQQLPTKRRRCRLKSSTLCLIPDVSDTINDRPAFCGRLGRDLFHCIRSRSVHTRCLVGRNLRTIFLA